MRAATAPASSRMTLYTLLAYQTFNVILLFIALNIGLGAIFFAYDFVKSATDSRVLSYRERFADYQAYTQLSKPEIDGFLSEQDAFSSLGFQYAPWVQFRNPQFKGRFLNTDKNGFRRTREPSITTGAPMKVYVFGGSTTFGYGVPDQHTIPSYVQKHLEVKFPARAIQVRNFGQGFYYSSQESLLFQLLLKDKDQPDWAIFIDGGNDLAQLSPQHDEPVFTPGIRRLWNARTGGLEASRGPPKWLPIARLAVGIAHRIGPSPAKPAEAPADQHQSVHDTNLSAERTREIADYVVDRYASNIRITRSLCNEFNIKCLFIWQPHPAYKYDRKLHKTFPFPGEIPAHYTQVHARMENFNAPGYLYLGNMTENVSKKVYVDDVHYNEATNEQMAVRIAQNIHDD